jgi:hypothetical protein
VDCLYVNTCLLNKREVRIPEGSIPEIEEEPVPAVYAVLRREFVAPGPVSCLTAGYLRPFHRGRKPGVFRQNRRLELFFTPPFSG